MKMTMGPEMRYGKALYALSMESGNESISKDVALALALFTVSDSLQETLANAIIEKEAKKKVLLTLLADLKATGAVMNFAALMCDKGRAGLFAGALSWFHFYEMEANGVVTANVRTAMALTATQKTSIKKFVKDNAQGVKTVELEEELDASLIAGFRVRIGSIEHDMSVRGRLDVLRTSLN
ncbi:MAG: F-type H+-transporting ATPase subunit delta [bacterium]|jgi:F-type H+-transporting ATPase subunit delta